MDMLPNVIKIIKSRRRDDWDVSIVTNAYKIFSLVTWNEEYIYKSRCIWEEYSDYL